MPLDDLERKIVNHVVQRFLNLKEPSPRRPMLSQYKSLEAFRRLTDLPILKKVGVADSEEYFPFALAFHYSGDPATITLARTSIAIVLRLLQNMFEVEIDKTTFTPADLEKHASKICNSPPLSDVIRFGLYLATEFDVLARWSFNPKMTEIVSFGIADTIIEVKDFDKAWDNFVAQKTPYIDNPEKFGSPEPQSWLTPMSKLNELLEPKQEDISSVPAPSAYFDRLNFHPHRSE